MAGGGGGGGGAKSIGEKKQAPTPSKIHWKKIPLSPHDNVGQFCPPPPF